MSIKGHKTVRHPYDKAWTGLGSFPGYYLKAIGKNPQNPDFCIYLKYFQNPDLSFSTWEMHTYHYKVDPAVGFFKCYLNGEFVYETESFTLTNTQGLTELLLDTESKFLPQTVHANMLSNIEVQQILNSLYEACPDFPKETTQILNVLRCSRFKQESPLFFNLHMSSQTTFPLAYATTHPLSQKDVVSTETPKIHVYRYLLEVEMSLPLGSNQLSSMFRVHFETRDGGSSWVTSDAVLRDKEDDWLCCKAEVCRTITSLYETSQHFERILR